MTNDLSVTSAEIINRCLMDAARARNFVREVDAPTLHERLNRLAESLELAAQEIVTLRGALYDEREGITAQTRSI